MGKYGLEHPRRPRGSQSRRDENRDWREVFNSRLVSTDCPWVSEDAQDGSRIQAEQVATIFILIGLLTKGAFLLSELAGQTHPSVCKENATI